MRSFVAAFIALSAFALPASAQDTRWTAPSGAWSLDYASQGWTFADPLPQDLQALYVRVIMPDAPPAAGETRMCGVTEIPINRSDPDTQRTRTTAGRVTMEAVARMYEPRRQTVTGVTPGAIGGVSYADIATVSARGTLHLHRIFYLPVEGQIVFVDIDCLWPPTLDAAKAAEIPAVLNTLAFNAVALQ